MSEEINESEYLRVTTPLKWFSGYDKVPVPILDYAADRGTRVHAYCTLYAHNMLFGEIDQDCIEYVQAFVNWFDEYCEKVIFTERRFFCHEWKIQGQPDLVCNVKGHPYAYGHCLVDIKTSLNYSKTWDLQTAAYKYLCTRNNIDIEERMIVHLHKDGSFDTIEYKDYDDKMNFIRHLDTYDACLKAHRFFS